MLVVREIFWFPSVVPTLAGEENLVGRDPKTVAWNGWSCGKKGIHSVVESGGKCVVVFRLDEGHCPWYRESRHRFTHPLWSNAYCRREIGGVCG